MIEAYYNNHQSVAKTAVLLNRSRQTIHKVYQFFKTGHNAQIISINTRRIKLAVVKQGVFEGLTYL